MTENQNHLNLPKEEIERAAKIGWQYVLDNTAAGSDDKAVVESC